ncbi:MAG TPA: PDZ domain-containing protein [Pirellulales bacterium]|nr:PDZ domain-containing protein [Pirellulales bacterium]
MRMNGQTWFFKFGALALSAGIWLSGAALHAQQFGPAVRFLLAGQKGDERKTDVAYWMGVACEPLPESLRAQLNLSEREGVLLEDVVEDGPADKAGLKQYDVVTAIDEKPVASQQELARLVVGSQGKELKVRYLRAGKEATAAVTPVERPSHMDFNSWVVPEGDQALIQNWLERLRPGMGPYPPALRFFHPGMVLPPEASTDAGLPDDMSVTISKQGKEPAKISVKQGERSWEVTEDKLDELPNDVRLPVERMLGRARFSVNILNDHRGDSRNWPEFPRPRDKAQPGTRGKSSDDADGRFERQIEEIREQLRQLQQAVDKLQPNPSPEK